ncbi:MAG: LacI family DNA-binding transcriptional regulator [Deltaproteobacteria bacterium]|nr:LacI family DNA-binding transcriptional regulator [Deltaproteobacteria bacterium]
MNVTLKDIAKALNVSHTAVSMALNGKAGVSDETRQRILKAAKEMNYMPNLAARSLISNKSGTLGLVISNIADPFYPKLARGVEVRANELGYNIILNNTDGNVQKEKHCIETLLSRGVDGIICSTVTVDDPNLDLLMERRFPFVALNRVPVDRPDADKIDYVVIDSYSGGYKAVNHLFRLGHDRIAVIAGAKKTSTTRDRTRGARQAMKDAGLQIDSKLIAYCNYERNRAFTAAKRLLAKDSAPTAFFTQDDNMALGVREAAFSLGLKIPEDIALVGFDDIDIAALTGIELTTISQKEYDMGVMATSILIDKIGNQSVHMVNKVTLEAKLLIRRSCGYRLSGYIR